MIADEIYALSVRNQKANPFQSVIKLLDNNLGTDVHFVWAFSKDFSCSGLRVGVVYSQNEVFIRAMETLNIFSCISGPIQYAISELLTDDRFVDSFLHESQARLRVCYEICVNKLEEMVVPYVPADAGLFIYVNFSSLLPEKAFAWEAMLSNLFFEYGRIVLTPGESQHDSRPGMFRICYAWVQPHTLEIAMERLSRMVCRIRRFDWEDLNERTMNNILS